MNRVKLAPRRTVGPLASRGTLREVSERRSRDAGAGASAKGVAASAVEPGVQLACGVLTTVSAERAILSGAKDLPPSRAPGPRASSRDGGYTLVAIMIFITLLTIAVLVVSPSVTMMMRRDREQELLFRGKQYAQAILNFQKRQGRFPLKLSELMKTQPRSARKLYKEPI